MSDTTPTPSTDQTPEPERTYKREDGWRIAILTDDRWLYEQPIEHVHEGDLVVLLAPGEEPDWEAARKRQQQATD